MSQIQKIPATVITGFLGAGKTSLIRHLLATANGRRLALIINEFGDMGVDGEVLKACGDEACREDDIVELANGCICCTVADDFLPTIEALLARPEPPDHIVIETSGLALPKPLVRAFSWPEVRTRVTVDGVIAVVDAAAVADGQFASDPAAVQAQREADEALDHDSPLAEVFEDQIQCADMVLVNKADLLDPPALARLTEDLSGQIRANIKVVPAQHGTVDADIVLGLDAGAETDLDARPSHHDGVDDHDHDDFESFQIALPEFAEPGPLAARLAAVLDAPGVLRVKGFAAIAGKDMRLVVQGVGDRLQHYFDRDWRPEENRIGRLVVIGLKGLDQDAITAAVAA
ncbi:MAG: cobalamin biosynthesis protein CobW [Alphaproteobacteria bacterium]|nr:cobalamin biosynthesis protein CobW [Alphaproteobacteria bacterium]